MFRGLAFTTVLCTAALATLTCSLSFGQAYRSIPETIEWTWEVRPANPAPNLPNVLLAGDSITRNYYNAVVEDLKGKANVYLFSTSASVGDPRLPKQLKEFFDMEAAHFRVVHFNNGMHGWGYSDTDYRDSFPQLVQELQKDVPGAKLIWANVTPVQKADPDGATNARINARNTIAAAVMRQHHIPVDDQHGLMMQHPDLYSDNVHPNKEASRLQARQAASEIEKLL